MRIAVEHEMFKEYFVSNLDFGLEYRGHIISKIPPKDMSQHDYYIIPIFDYENDVFYRRIKYVDDVFQYTKDAIQINNIKGDRGDMHMKMKPFGYYKHKRWEFQDETRFVLYALPCNPMLEGSNPEISSIVMQSLLTNKSLPFTYYDMELKDDIFDSIEITLSPSSTDAQRVIIQALIDKYAPNVKIHNSALGELVRF